MNTNRSRIKTLNNKKNRISAFNILGCLIIIFGALFYLYLSNINIDKIYAVSGDGTQSSPYQISTAQDLITLSQSASMWGTSTSDRVYIVLVNDILLDVTEWTPIGNSSSIFYGNFDGQGHKITFTQSVVIENQQYSGLFGYTNANILNTIVNWQGGLNISYNSTSSLFAGGFLAYNVSTTVQIEECGVLGNINVNSSGNAISASGFAGYANGYSSNIPVQNCFNMANLTVETYGNYTADVGGISGTSATIRSCFNSGNITVLSNEGSAYVGGIVGGDSRQMGVYDSYNTGDINATSLTSYCYVGGVLSYGRELGFTNCYNVGNLSGTGTSVYVAGITTRVDYAAGIRNCYNLGTMDANATNTAQAGGIFAYDGSFGTNSIYNCFSIVGDNGINASGTTVYVGGISARPINSSYTNMGNCYYDFPSSGSTENLSSLVKEINNFGSSGELNWNATNIWDFENTWTINGNYNNGYPLLIDVYHLTIKYKISDNNNAKTNFQIYSYNDLTTNTLYFLDNNVFESEGYYYNQWTDGQGNYYNCNDAMTLTEDTILFPVWLTAEVTFNLTITGDIKAPALIYVIVDNKITRQLIFTNNLNIGLTVEPTVKVTLMIIGNNSSLLQFDENDNILINNNCLNLINLQDTVINATLSEQDKELNDSIFL